METDTIRARLEEIADELADLALDNLRAGIRGDTAAAARERRVTRARRAVTKAAMLLEGDDQRDEAASGTAL